MAGQTGQRCDESLGGDPRPSLRSANTLTFADDKQSGMEMKRTVPVFLVFGLASCAPAFAASTEPRFYAGVALGRSSVDGPSQTQSTLSGFPLTGLPLNGFPLHDHDTSWSAFVGYTVTRYVGLELGFWDHGTFKNDRLLSPALAMLPALDIKEWYFGPTLRYPLNQRLALTGSAGISRAQFDVTGSAYVGVFGPGNVPSFQQLPFERPADETGGFWRFGLNWRVTNSLETSLSYGTRDLQVQQVKTVGVSVQMAF